MNRLAKGFATTAVGMLLGLLLAGSALAGYYPGNIDTLATFMTGASYDAYSGAPLSGAYELTPLGFEAGDTIHFKSSSSGEILFTNQQLANEFNTGWKTADLTSAVFKDVKTSLETGVNEASRVAVLKLAQDWTVSSGLTLKAGTLILGLNDDGSADGDFDDFILAAKATPIPGAVWLLGSGLLGMLGFRRGRKNA